MTVAVRRSLRASGPLRRHALLAYLLLAFGIAWGGAAFSVVVFGMSAPALLGAMLAGPTAASLVLTGVVDGAAGYRKLLRSLWHLPARRWYAALLINPLVLLSVLGALSLASRAFVPGIFATSNPGSLLAIAIAAGLLAGMFEELGWTGFATPQLLASRGPLAAGLILGLVWATWHIGPDLLGAAGDWGSLHPWRILTWMYAGMVPYRVLMTFVYRHTESLLLGVLMHGVYTGGQVLLEPIGASQTEQLIWWAVLGLALWFVVGMVMTAAAARDSAPGSGRGCVHR
ncbi:MAG: CPBP family intramembrane metalloprotease [Leptolyngbya sp. PLA1]|nr:CPBP family intramembrane metalloprotease [Leptolyngbya sp. PLA1]